MSAHTPASAPFGERCRRYPCDVAYRRGVHPAGTHSVSWMSGYEMGAEGIEVEAAAIENQPWFVRMSMGDVAASLDPDEATRLIEALLKALRTVNSANLADAVNGR